jgi:hypothetical protein
LIFGNKIYLDLKMVIFMVGMATSVVVVDLDPDPYVFGPSGSAIVCTDPDPSITKQKK